MIHPSYTELMQVVNSSVEADEQPVVQSRYSIVLATSKRARQIISGDAPMAKHPEGKKPLSMAVEELHNGDLKILTEEEAQRMAEEAKAVMLAMEEEMLLAQEAAEAAEAAEAENAGSEEGPETPEADPQEEK